MSDPSVVSAAPFMEILSPYINAVVQVVVAAGVSYGAFLWHKWTGREIAQADQDKVTKAAQDQAGIIFAKGEAGISTESIKVTDPRIQASAQFLQRALKTTLDATGTTPDDVAHAVQAELGKLQAQSTSTAPAAPADAPEVKKALLEAQRRALDEQIAALVTPAPASTPAAAVKP
jgi:hypothetical protein